MQMITDWFRRLLIDPQAVILLLILIIGTSVVLFFGRMLTPVLAGLVIAYLLEGLIQRLEHWHLPRNPAVYLVFGLFSLFVMIRLFWLLPLVSGQLTQLMQQLPNMVLKGQELLLNLPKMYPHLLSEEQIVQATSLLKAELGTVGQQLLSLSLAAGIGFLTIAIYLFLVPFLVFFFLKDKQQILGWFRSFLPEDYSLSLSRQVWREVDAQIGNYVRGKFWEVIMVWVASFVTFSLMGLQFAMLLGLAVGISVIIPYIGAVVVTVPVAVVAFFQWGWSSEFLWLMGAYAVIQGLDGYVIVPVMFSEAVNLHPIAIIVAMLLFGGLWGFWGVFFAIPLATVVQAVLNAWPGRVRALPI